MVEAGVPRFYYAPLKFYLVTKKDTWEQHPANLIPPLTTKHASALSVDRGNSRKNEVALETPNTPYQVERCAGPVEGLRATE